MNDTLTAIKVGDATVGVESTDPLMLIDHIETMSIVCTRCNKTMKGGDCKFDVLEMDEDKGIPRKANILCDCGAILLTFNHECRENKELASLREANQIVEAAKVQLADEAKQ